MNGSCPEYMSGAKTIAYAIVAPHNIHTGKTKHNVAGKAMPSAKAMVICQYAGEACFYVFGCYTEEWVSETDTWHECIEDAIDQLDWEYESLSKEIVWMDKSANVQQGEQK